MAHLDRNRANKMLQESVARVPVCAIAEKHTSAILLRINFVRKKDYEICICISKIFNLLNRDAIF